MIAVTVAWSPGPREVQERALQLPEGATVRQALEAAGVDGALYELGVWGRRCDADTVLRENDRVELYRPLRVDPKVARRERFRKQGVRAAGLFAGKRPGKKAGY
jgi:putative ubiquitin-RnfH superfamily antitoxin RatB of RatAB toxin-antitoxin module